jgi:hypothetical protein
MRPAWGVKRIRLGSHSTDVVGVIVRRTRR